MNGFEKLKKLLTAKYAGIFIVCLIVITYITSSGFYIWTMRDLSNSEIYLAELQSHFAELQSQTQKSKNKIDSLNDKIRDLEGERTKKTQSLEEVQNKLKELDTINQNLEARNRTLESQAIDYHNLLKNLKSLEKQQEILIKGNQQLLDEEERLKARITNLPTVASLEKKQRDYQELEKAIVDLSKEKSTLSLTCHDLNEQKSALTTKIDNAKIDLKQLKDTSFKLEFEINQRGTNILELDSDISKKTFRKRKSSTRMDDCK